MAMFVPLALALVMDQTKTKKPAPPKPKPVMGTKQVDRTKAEIGQVYTIGKTYPINFKIVEAKFALRASYGEHNYVALENEKLLLLKIEYQNPTKYDLQFRYDALKFVTVSPDNQNHEFEPPVYDVDTNREYNENLKPGQRVTVNQVLNVHADGPVFKMFVEREEDRLAFDLRNKVTPLAAPWAKNADTVAKQIEFKLGDVIPCREWDIMLDKMDPAVPAGPPDGDGNPTTPKKNLVFYGTVTNRTNTTLHFRYDTANQEYMDEDGAQETFSYIYKFRSDEGVDNDIPGGGSLKIRIVCDTNQVAKKTSMSLLINDRKATIKIP